MNIKYEKITTKHIIKFLESEPIIMTSLSKGSKIGGGFPRFCYHKIHNLDTTLLLKNRYKHLKISHNDIYNDNDLFFYLMSGGDIDCFFSDESNYFETLSLYLKHLEDKKDDPSSQHLSWSHQSFFATNYWLSHTAADGLRRKVQLINKFFYQNIEDLFNSFDIKNCRYAIIKELDDYYLAYDEAAVILDEQKVLSIAHSNSPFTIYRVQKYLNKRNLNTLTRNSHKLIGDIITKIAFSKFSPNIINCLPEKIYDILSYPIKTAFESGLIDSNDALFFIGKYLITKPTDELNSYASFVEVDWAVDFLAKSVKEKEDKV